jgi:PIN domain nuclease of toxin-antitoxin system
VIVLDTHVLIWWVDGSDRLSPAAEAAIVEAKAGGQILVSSISAWEIAMLATRGRLVLSLDVARWLDFVSAIDTVTFVPVDNEIGVKSVDLPGPFHKDPADRMIIATARKFGVALVSADEKIRAYSHVKTIW